MIALLASALTQPLAAFAFVLDGLVLGVSDYAAMRTAMIVAALAYAPAGALVLAFHRLGLPGIWLALGIWLAARSATLGRYWYRKTFKYLSHNGRGTPATPRPTPAWHASALLAPAAAQ